jgi:hypothetical protein
MCNRMSKERPLLAMTPTPLELADGFKTLTPADISRLVDYVFAHRKDAIKDFLADDTLPANIKKDELRSRFEKAITAGEKDPPSLVSLLDSIEGWGNQHIYLYEAPEGETKIWRSETRAIARLKKMECENLFNRRRPLVLPDEPTLSSVEWTANRVRFIWVEKRDWELRREDLDQHAVKLDEAGNIKLKAYESKASRGITSFDWNLTTGEAALMIQRLPSGERYDEIRLQYEQAIEDAVHIADFERRDIRKAIRKIENSIEVSKRQVAHETQHGGRISFTSKSRKADAYDDPDLKKSRKALGQTATVLGNFYWFEAPPQLERSIHVKLYATDRRIGIFGECSEREVQYVLSRIRNHCQ